MRVEFILADAVFTVRDACPRYAHVFDPGGGGVTMLGVSTPLAPIVVTTPWDDDEELCIHCEFGE